MFPSVCIYTEPTHRASPWNLLSVWAGCFVNIRWLEGAGLGIIVGITAISGTVFIELFTLSEGEGRRREGWLCGCLMPSIFLCQRGFSSVSNPARAPAAPRMASPTAQDTSSQTNPSPPAIHPACSLVGAPMARLWSLEPSSHCWNDCSDSSVFLLVRRDSLLSALLYWATAVTGLTVKQADRLIDWLDKSQEAQNTAYNAQSVCLILYSVWVPAHWNPFICLRKKIK